MACISMISTPIICQVWSASIGIRGGRFWRPLPSWHWMQDWQNSLICWNILGHQYFSLAFSYTLRNEKWTSQCKSRITSFLRSGGTTNWRVHFSALALSTALGWYHTRYRTPCITMNSSRVDKRVLSLFEGTSISSLFISFNLSVTSGSWDCRLTRLEKRSSKWLNLSSSWFWRSCVNFDFAPVSFELIAKAFRSSLDFGSTNCGLMKSGSTGSSNSFGSDKCGNLLIASTWAILVPATWTISWSSIEIVWWILPNLPVGCLQCKSEVRAWWSVWNMTRLCCK